MGTLPHEQITLILGDVCVSVDGNKVKGFKAVGKAHTAVRDIDTAVRGHAHGGGGHAQDTHTAGRHLLCFRRLPGDSFVSVTTVLVYFLENVVNTLSADYNTERSQVDRRFVNNSAFVDQFKVLPVRQLLRIKAINNYETFAESVVCFRVG